MCVNIREIIMLVVPVLLPCIACGCGPWVVLLLSTSSYVASVPVFVEFVDLSDSRDGITIIGGGIVKVGEVIGVGADGALLPEGRLDIVLIVYQIHYHEVFVKYVLRYTVF